MAGRGPCVPFLVTVIILSLFGFNCSLLVLECVSEAAGITHAIASEGQHRRSQFQNTAVLRVLCAWRVDVQVDGPAYCPKWGVKF